MSVTVTVTVDNCCCPPPPPSPLSLVWHIGPAFDTNESDRTPGEPPAHVEPRKADVIMDLLADKKVALSVEFTDEVGNPVPAPTDAVIVYTVDDPSIIALTDNGDGTAEAAATGALGTANVHVEVSSVLSGLTLTGDLQLVVVAGLAERINVVAGPPEEVTPDV